MSVFEYGVQQHYSSRAESGFTPLPLAGRHRAPTVAPSRLRSVSSIALVAAVPAAVPAAVMTGSFLLVLLVAIGTVVAVELAGLMI